MLVSQPRLGAVSFLGTHSNKIDAKGRVQMPAGFRRALEGDQFQGFFCYPNLDAKRLDCGGSDFVEGLKASIAMLDPYDPDREALEIAVLGEIQTIPTDQDGRFIMPKTLREYLDAESRVRFIGCGDTFQIWSDEGGRMAKEDHAERAKSALRRLRNPGSDQPPPNPPIPLRPR